MILQCTDTKLMFILLNASSIKIFLEFYVAGEGLDICENLDLILIVIDHGANQIFKVTFTFFVKQM